MSNIKVPHELITIELLKEWGYIPSKYNTYVNWNGVWVRQIDGDWEYGNPNYHTIDKEHPFIKHGVVNYLDELRNVQKKRGLENINYNKSQRVEYEH